MSAPDSMIKNSPSPYPYSVASLWRVELELYFMDFDGVPKQTTTKEVRNVESRSVLYAMNAAIQIAMDAGPRKDFRDFCVRGAVALSVEWISYIDKANPQ